ncbi:nucleotidyl transferase AbiEii/AbiGii toxin family protein [Alkalimonas mucilaginosa]|uniref:Nucleotidyl transferase AbiEii/AbiGii toxin family protein n=1 Tax=Alkalimonas mucilaginosa TaxID=3057676 RepID=A0ABU7JC53_9GAMM|nr:nucleotidyl transferase AbiEii/AbiGii toxin family protein [Alkalimonas sp. MEB004]MEE2023016.1 nucleotidyl transferase AbiEii/AbiGii toxin family protein [Alkalimonas sp. MEB004]
MSAYKRAQHQRIAACLENFNSDFLSQHTILFGGGTRIALEFGEYRESVDIDFLCPDKAAYRAVRQQVTNQSLGKLVRQDFHYSRDIIFDRYGVRTFIVASGVPIKLEFVAFDNYQLEPDKAGTLFPVPYIDHTSCYVTKLLANADRVGVKPYKDILDILVMCAYLGEIPQAALDEAYSHYSKKVIDQSLQKSLLQLTQNTAVYAEAAVGMGVDSHFFSNVILPAAQKLLAAPAVTSSQSEQ